VGFWRKKWKKLLRWMSKALGLGDTGFEFCLLSYPKCGRTWLTMQLGRCFQQHFGVTVPNLLKLKDMKKLCPAVPGIRITHDGTPHRKRPDELPESKKEYGNKRVIFMVRDPRDVFVSYYFHKSKREQPRKFWFFQRKRRQTHSPFTGTISEFLHESIGGFDTLLRYYNIWAKNRDVPKDFLLVRYEDMHADPRKEFRRVLNFIGLQDLSDEVVRDAVEYTAFDKMQKMERSGGGAGSYKLRTTDASDTESLKVRRGKVAGYADYLTPEEIESLNRKMRETLTDFYGYKPCVKSPPSTPA